MVVAGRSNGDTKQILIIIHRFNDSTEEQKELCVFVGRFAGSKQIHTGIGIDGPVIMLSASVDARKGLFVEKADKAVFCGNLLHNFHSQLVMVCRHIGCRVNRRKLMLCGRNFVVFGFRKNTQLPQLMIQILHKGRHTGFDDAKIMVVHFLPLGRLCAKQSPSGKEQILPLVVHFSVHKEIFLLGSHRGFHTLNGAVAKQANNTHSLLI